MTLLRLTDAGLSEFTGTAPRDARAGDRVFVIADDEIVDATER